MESAARCIPCKAVTHDADFLGRLLAAIESDVVPLTEEGVKAGNKLFGACVLRKDDCSLVVAGTNLETEWPLLHGEISCLRNISRMPADKRPNAKDCIFIATHEPCSLCLSAITWSGYDNFYYLFSYVDTKDAFNIPHDLKILSEVFKCEGGCYSRQNAYWNAYDITSLVQSLEDGEARSKLEARIESLRKKYDEMSKVYQDSKEGNDIPLS
eukprot:CAMPEP_0178427802 /NCGR_PEP_ID=MMETSP0689_2-20121128/29934_1 /TAXON_ID=160604 /ORGANISM="Amphidinium massartii, Strain CS-259" /LENGTH=211 /DNA_ID=CAMNT_0020049523 /DNA_START=135 /DNA_END=770 /DNA_ORIENTATION=-